MTGYRIDPKGVETVLNATKSDAEKFGTILKPLQGWVEFAATGTGGSGAIVPAFQSFFENQSVGLKTINNRVGAAINGAYEATKAYLDGVWKWCRPISRTPRSRQIRHCTECRGNWEATDA